MTRQQLTITILMTFTVAVSSSSIQAEIMPSTATSLKTGKMESDSTIFLLREQFSVLSSDLHIDGTPTDPMGEIGGMLAAGREVQSWLLHSDKVGSTQDRVDVSGTFDFEAPILGLVFMQATLDVTDPLLGDPAIEYPTGAFLPVNGRYYRGTGPADTQAVVADVWELVSPTTLRVNMQTNSVGIDQMRIITAIPEPSTAALLLCGLIATLVGRRRAR